MRKALIVLVVAAVVLALGLVAVSLVNLREAQSLSRRSVELRAVDQATAFARRIATERPWTRTALQGVEDLLGDEVPAGIAWQTGPTSCRRDRRRPSTASWGRGASAAGGGLRAVRAATGRSPART